MSRLSDSNGVIVSAGIHTNRMSEVSGRVFNSNNEVYATLRLGFDEASIYFESVDTMDSVISEMVRLRKEFVDKKNEREA